jgi:sugar lactone lactonase YvrE
MDDEGSLYVTDMAKDEVRRYRRGETTGNVVAGGNGKGAGLHQLNFPIAVCVEGEHTVYVSDCENHRVMKWVKDANEGIVVAGGRDRETDPTRLLYPYGVLVDEIGTVHVVDCGDHRAVRWCRAATQGVVVVGGNGQGQRANQFNSPTGLSFDRQGNLYVTDYDNHRVQQFSIEKSWIKDIAVSHFVLVRLEISFWWFSLGHTGSGVRRWKVCWKREEAAVKSTETVGCNGHYDGFLLGLKKTLPSWMHRIKDKYV